ncbi:hypothetical protein, partial [uncultured Dietzia sp.]|uniref:hypothetical protein n=1 Tax=uncultured Dietzia sp. TaxID=395519 RepID=UPI00343656F9
GGVVAWVARARWVRVRPVLEQARGVPGLSGPCTAGDEDPHQATTTRRSAPAASGVGLPVCGLVGDGVVVVIIPCGRAITDVPG